MKKLLYIATVLIFCSVISKNASAQNNTSAQDYKIALGLKFGAYENGPSVKYFMNSNTALEGELGLRSHGLVITGLYEIHQPAFGVSQLNFYYGFGAHVGGVGKGAYQRFNGDTRNFNSNHILLGADGVVGLEYLIPSSPIAVSLDLNPRAELATGPFFDIAPGLGIKYTFK